MSRQRNTPLTIALCASLTVHAGLVYVLVRAAVNAPIWLPGSGRIEEPGAAMAPIEEPRPSSFDDGLRDSALGAVDGIGHAIDPSPGDSALEARKGDQDQQFLSRDPVGPGDPNNLPSMSPAPPGEALRRALASASPSDATAVTPMFGVVEAPPQSAPQQREAPVAREHVEDGKELAAKRQATAVPASASETQPQTPQPQTPVLSAPLAPPRVAAPAQSAAVPAANVQPADPAPMSDSESDPFSVQGSVRFRPGKTDVQLGRKHRLVRPRFDLASMDGAMQLRRPITVGLKLWLDENGTVTRVVIAHSSGSPEVDQPVKVAAYEWWLEPTKDPKTGKPVPDVIGFLVRLE